MTWYIEHRYNVGKRRGAKLKKATRKRKDEKAAKRLTGRKLSDREKRGGSHPRRKAKTRVVTLDDLAVWKK